MDLFTAIRERRSTRKFLAESVSDDAIEKIIDAAIWAPSAANNQPWEFIVITNQDVKRRIYEESIECKKILYEKSGWKWIDRYQAGFLLDAPVIIAVIGDPEKAGAHRFLEGTETVYQHGCAAAVQTMLLSAHALGLGSLWFTLFDRAFMKRTLGIDPSKEPLALICLGKAAEIPPKTPRKAVREVTRFIR